MNIRQRCVNTFCLLLLTISLGWGQSVFGTVADASTGEKLPFVSVFFNNTSIATETTLEGKFALNNVPTGTYTLVFRQVGYKAFTLKVSLEKTTKLPLEIKLQPDEKLLQEVKVLQKKDKVWEQRFEVFTQQFLGDRFAKNQCRIVNPWVLDFTEEKNVLTAKASDIIEINNQELGYQVRYSLNEFRFDGAQVFFSGLAEFTSLFTNDAAQKARWEQKRAEAYRGSDIHFFKSLQARTASQEGFEFFVDKPGEDPTKRTPFFYQNQVKKLSKIVLDSLVRTVKNFYSLAIPSRIEVHFNGKEGVFSIYKDKPCQVAWIETNGQPLQFNSQGIILNPQACSVSGYLAENRVASLLPLDYTPPKELNTYVAKALTRTSETAYFTTDKPYYFTNDEVNVSGYMRYSNEEAADTLSQLVYLEFVNPSTQKIVTQQRLKLENRHFSTHFTLTDSLVQPSTYLLRAYTKWTRKQSDSGFVYRWIPVIKNDERALFTSTTRLDSAELKVEEQGDSLLISIPSHTFVWGTTVMQKGKIDARLPLITPSIGSNTQSFEVERGATVSGYVTNYRSAKHESVVILLPSTNLSFFTTINSKGFFTFKELPLEGQQQVVVQVLNAKGKTVVDAAVLLDSLIAPKWIPALPTNEWRVEPFFNEGLRKGEAIMLSEVQVKAKTPPKPIASIYKEADYVLQGKDLYENAVGMNILSAIQGRVPGLRIVEFPDENGLTKLVITMRMGASAGGFVKTKLPQPLVLVDGTPFDNINMIAQIPASQVERVEVVNRAESLLGVRGYVGAISIITKHAGASTNEREVVASKGVHKFLVNGLSPHVPPRLGQLVAFWQGEIIPSPSSMVTTVKVAKPRQTGVYSIYFEGLTIQGKPVAMTNYYTIR